MPIPVLKLPEISALPTSWNTHVERALIIVLPCLPRGHSAIECLISHPILDERHGNEPDKELRSETIQGILGMPNQIKTIPSHLPNTCADADYICREARGEKCKAWKPRMWHSLPKHLKTGLSVPEAYLKTLFHGTLQVR
jgi:hypothetical protein